VIAASHSVYVVDVTAVSVRVTRSDNLQAPAAKQEVRRPRGGRYHWAKTRTRQIRGARRIKATLPDEMPALPGIEINVWRAA